MNKTEIETKITALKKEAEMITEKYSDIKLSSIKGFYWLSKMHEINNEVTELQNLLTNGI